MALVLTPSGWVRMAAAIALALPPPAQSQPSEPLKVTAVRFWTQGDATNIAVETTGAFRYKSDRLSRPERVFYDFPGARSGFGARGIHTIRVDDNRVKQIRVAETQRGVTRVVIDLAGDVQCNATVSDDSHQLMIQVRGGSADVAPKPPDTPPTIAARLSLKPAPVPMNIAALPPPPAPTPTAAPPLVAPTPDAATPAKRGDRSLTRALGLKIRRVVIDPGHGGQDHGSTGHGGLVEKELVLDIARRLGAIIEERMGSEVVYTRSSDEFIALEERTAIANRNHADLFLSIHANSSPLRSASGSETYYLNFTTSRTAMELAARENATSQKGVYELRDILQKIALKDKLDESREFAGRLQTSLYGVSGVPRPTGSARDRGVKKAPFIVLIGASMPSVLAEIGFVSNPREEALLKKPEHRQKIAEALYKGIANYEASLSHFLAQGKAPGSE
jgi:N-acetylmuramoyl-L-alanine amidase